MILYTILPLVDYITDVANTAISIAGSRMDEKILGYSMLLNLMLTPIYTYYVSRNINFESQIKRLLPKRLSWPSVPPMLAAFVSPLTIIYFELSMRIQYIKVTLKFRDIIGRFGAIRKLVYRSLKISQISPGLWDSRDIFCTKP